MLIGTARLKKTKSKVIKQNILQYTYCMQTYIYAVVSYQRVLASWMPFAILSIAAIRGKDTDVSSTV